MCMWREGWEVERGKGEGEKSQLQEKDGIPRFPFQTVTASQSALLMTEGSPQHCIWPPASPPHAHVSFSLQAAFTCVLICAERRQSI